MNKPLAADANVQALFAILILSFSLALILAGIIIRRFRIFDEKKKPEGNTGFSLGLGKIFIVVGSILGLVALMLLILVMIG